MKIVHISYTFFDGFAYQDNEIAKIQARMGHEVVVISLLKQYYTSLQARNIPEEPIYFENKCKIIRLPFQYKWNFRFNKFKGLDEVLEDENPDLILFHQTPYLSMLDVVKYKKKYRNVKIHIDFHCDYYNSGKSIISRVLLHKIWYRFLTIITKKYVNTYYYITPDTKKFVKEMYLIPEDRLNFLPLGCDLEQVDCKNKEEIKIHLRNTLGIKMTDLVVITGGRLDEAKNTHKLIEAYQDVASIINNLHLIIFGTADDKYSQLLHRIAQENSKIHFVGWLNSLDVYKYYLSSDIACFPGSQSVVWQQAIVCGLPLLCRRWDGVEYLNVDNNVIFIESENKEDIYSKLSEVLLNESIRNRMKLGAETTGRIFFSYQRIAQIGLDA